MSLQRASGKEAPYQGWDSNSELVLLPQLLAEGESRLVRFKIKGHMDNMALPTASWDAFAEGALLGSFRFRIQVICLATHNPSLNLLETHFCWTYLTKVFSSTTRWSHSTEGSHNLLQLTNSRDSSNFGDFQVIKRALLNGCPQECLKSIRHTVKLVVYSYQIDSANKPPIQYFYFVCLNTELSGINGYKGETMGDMERGFPHLGHQGIGFHMLCTAISGKKR